MFDKPHPPRTPVETVYAHCVRTMPDNVSARRELLNALNLLLPETHPKKTELDAALHHLDLHIIAQRELPLE